MASFHGILLLCLSILCIGGYAVFIEPDQRKLHEAEEKLTDKKAIQVQLEKDIQATRAQIDKLKTRTPDGALAVEHVAREKLGYCKPSEEIYIFGKDEVSGATAKPVKFVPPAPAAPAARR